MAFIRTDGLSFLGPGSEWFWTALQAVVVTATLWGLLRQVRLQTAQKMREDVESFSDRWDSERMLRHRLDVAIARRDGNLDELGGNAPNIIANFWEGVATLTRAKHLDKTMIVVNLGDYFCHSWDDVQPWIQRMRRSYSSTDIFCDWEWLVHEAARIVPSLALSVGPPVDPETSVQNLQKAIETEVELRH